MKYRLRRGTSVWDSVGKAPQTGFGRVLLMAGTRNHRGLVPVRCEQTSRRGWARLEDLEVLGDNNHEQR